MSVFKGKTVLFSYWASSCSFRVRIALHMKDIPHEIRPISIIKVKPEQFSNEFTEINPMQRVPALQIDGLTLIESLNILHYLEETRPEKPLMPADFKQRARVREICEIISSGIQPLQNIGVLEHLEKEKRLKWAQYWIDKGFQAVEKLVSTSNGKFSVGDQITLADCCLIPQIFNARRYKVDLGRFPVILRIDKELENHSAFRAAHPLNQPDCPPEAAK